VVDYTGTGGIWQEFSFNDEFKTKQSIYLTPRLKQPDTNISKFQNCVEKGVSFYLNFEIWKTDAPNNNEVRKQIRKIKNKTEKLAQELYDLHINAYDVIAQSYVINSKDYDFNFPQNVSNNLLELDKACDDALELTATKKGPNIGNILHIPSLLKKAISNYALEEYSSISYSEGSFFVSYLDAVFEYLSLDNTFGDKGHIFDRSYKPEDTARTIAKSYKNRSTN